MIHLVLNDNHFVGLTTIAGMSCAINFLLLLFDSLGTESVRHQ